MTGSSGLARGLLVLRSLMSPMGKLPGRSPWRLPQRLAGDAEGNSDVMDLSRAQWRKSSFSGTTGGNCVEVARNLPGAVAVRDSKNPDGPKLVFTPDEWRAFTAEIRGAEL